MRIGISISSTYQVTDYRIGARWMVERARAAAEAGLDSLFVGDHHVTPQPYYQNTPISARTLADGTMRQPARSICFPFATRCYWQKRLRHWRQSCPIASSCNVRLAMETASLLPLASTPNIAPRALKNAWRSCADSGQVKLFRIRDVGRSTGTHFAHSPRTYRSLDRRKRKTSHRTGGTLGRRLVGGTRLDKSRSTGKCGLLRDAAPNTNENSALPPFAA